MPDPISIGMQLFGIYSSREASKEQEALRQSGINQLTTEIGKFPALEADVKKMYGEQVGILGAQQGRSIYDAYKNYEASFGRSGLSSSGALQESYTNQKGTIYDAFAERLFGAKQEREKGLTSLEDWKRNLRVQRAAMGYMEYDDPSAQTNPTNPAVKAGAGYMDVFSEWMKSPEQGPPPAPVELGIGAIDKWNADQYNYAIKQYNSQNPDSNMSMDDTVVSSNFQKTGSLNQDSPIMQKILDIGKTKLPTTNASGSNFQTTGSLSSTSSIMQKILAGITKKTGTMFQ